MKDGGFAVSFYGWNKVDLFMDAWKAAGFRVTAGLIVYPRSASVIKAFPNKADTALLGSA
ncbi:hypothetical protein [Pseudochelatococcus contaminans]|uniref:hypothetical protein n=1 Tax=Pseudochelatococcus contaminans TaxID=1538103 RepID=UPI001AEDAE49